MSEGLARIRRVLIKDLGPAEMTPRLCRSPLPRPFNRSQSICIELMTL